MTMSTPVPVTIEVRRSRLLGLIALVAVVAAVITWALLTYAVDTGVGATQRSVKPTASAASLDQSFPQFAKSISTMAAAQQAAAVANAAEPGFRQFVKGISTMAAAQQAAAMANAADPEFKQFIKGITAMAAAQQAAAANSR